MIHPFPATAPAFSVSATATASTAAALGMAPEASGLFTVRLVNEGPHRCYVAFGGSAVEATVPTATALATATPVLAGEDLILSISPSQTHISAITRTSETATLIVCGAAEGA